MTNIKRDSFTGFIFGFLLLIAQVNLTFGMLLLLFGTLFYYYRYFTVNFTLIDITIALVIKIFWIVFIWVFFKSSSVFLLAQTLVVDLMLLSMLFMKINEDFLKNFSKPLVLLLLIDFVFNLSIYIFGADFFGRGGALRPGDIIPRVGGVFGHPFYSVNIALIGIFCGFILKNRYVAFIGLTNFLMNGTFRSLLTVILLFIFIYAIKMKMKLKYLIIGSILFAATVFILTIYSAGGDEYGGNTLRVFAWINAIDHILQNPWLGTHTFSTAPLDDMSMDVIEEHGIAESAYLQYALDYGIPVMILHFYIIFRLFHSNYKRYFFSEINNIYKYWALVFAGVIFADTFYGSLFGSVLTTYFAGILLIAYQDKNVTSYDFKKV